MLTIPAYAALQVAAPARDALAQAADIATVVIGVAVLVVALALLAFLARLNRAVRELREGARLTLGPVSERARRVSDNVEFITDALRTDVEHLTGSVRALSDRLQHASDRMEERIEEFNALMEVVQGEAEGLFLDTAATVRGVREGARAIGGSAREGDDATEPDAARAPAPVSTQESSS